MILTGRAVCQSLSSTGAAAEFVNPEKRENRAFSVLEKATLIYVTAHCSEGGESATQTGS